MFGLLCVIYLGFAGHAAYVESPTVDEFQELPSGLNYWKHGNFEVENGNPPFAKLWASLPLLVDHRIVSPEDHPQGNDGDMLEFGRAFEVANQRHFLEVFFPARLMILSLTLILALLIFLTVAEIGSEEIALTVSSLFLLSPTVLAHGHLATCDMGGALTLFGSWFAYRRTKSASLAGLLFGFAIATKLTALLLFPWFLLWVIVTEKQSGRKPVKIIAQLFLFMITLLFGIGASYGFQEWGHSWSSLALRSARMLSLPIPDWMPTPLPAAFVHGIDGKFSVIGGGGFYSYLLGTWSASGFPQYYLVAFCLKESITTILAVLCGLALGLRKRSSLALFIPVAVILISLSIGNPQQLGLRYFLPAYPFLFVMIAFALNRVRWPRVFSAILVAAAFSSVALTTPNFIGYFNSLGLWFANGSDLKLLADSNLDWGQDLYQVPQIAKDHLASAPVGLMYWGETSPLDYGINYYLPSVDGLKPGLVIISANFLTGYDFFTPTPEGKFLWIETSRWAWMKDLKFLERRGSLFVFEFAN